MNDLEFAALLVSRVCHDLVSPVGAVVNGLELLDEERDTALRADALKLVASSAALATARLQFARIAFGAAGSSGAELDLTEVGRMVGGFLSGGKIQLHWNAAPVNWPKDWAKLLMNCVIIAADTLSRGGSVSVKTSAGADAPGFLVSAAGQTPRLNDEVTRVLQGEPITPTDGRSVQSYLTYRLANALHTRLSLHVGEGTVTILAGEMGSHDDSR